MNNPVPRTVTEWAWRKLRRKYGASESGREQFIPRLSRGIFGPGDGVVNCKCFWPYYSCLCSSCLFASDSQQNRRRPSSLSERTEWKSQKLVLTRVKSWNETGNEPFGTLYRRAGVEPELLYYNFTHRRSRPELWDGLVYFYNILRHANQIKFSGAWSYACILKPDLITWNKYVSCG